MATTVEMYDEAIALQAEGQVEEAVGKLNDLLKESPDYALAHSALSKFYSVLEKHDEAVEHAKKVCEIAPEDPFSHTQLSVIYQRAYAGTNNQQYIQDAEEAMARSQMLQQGQA